MNDSIQLLREECRKNIGAVTQLYFDTHLTPSQIAKELNLKPSQVKDIIEGNIPAKQRQLREDEASKPTANTNSDKACELFGLNQVKAVMFHYNNSDISYLLISAQPDVYVSLKRVTEIIHANTTPEERERRRAHLVTSNYNRSIATYAHIARTVTTTYKPVDPLDRLQIKPGMLLSDLQHLYLTAINNLLPSLATANGWPIHLNHCFARVILDTLFEGCWYNHLKRGTTPAYKQLSRTQLFAVLTIIEGIVAYPDTLPPLNELSKSYRQLSHSDVTL